MVRTVPESSKIWMDLSFAILFSDLMGFVLSFLISVLALGLGFTMVWYKCLRGNKRLTKLSESDSRPFSLPSPLPDWPPGHGFASGTINLGELEVSRITEYEPVFQYNKNKSKKRGVTFYKPVRIPDGFHCLGHHCQLNDRPLRGFVLVARDLTLNARNPALCSPLDYVLARKIEEDHGNCGYLWLPQAPEGYKPVGFLVSDEPEKPSLDEAKCVRADLTDDCDAHKALLECNGFRVLSARPRHRGIAGRGVPVGSFFCGEEIIIRCLKNLNPGLHGMPNLSQIHSLINHYGPTVFFHPKELCFPSSVAWFFRNGALLYRAGSELGEPVDPNGENLPSGGTNDGKFWLDLPRHDEGERRERVKRGDLESAVIYAHAKPALGGAFTDIAMWIFCPFNGPACLKIGAADVALSRIGGHVCDWEHFTLRISNFEGELWGVYYAQHSAGEWVEACDLEFVKGNRPTVYSSKHGHASYPRPGTRLQGSSRLGVGIRNDSAISEFFVDSSVKYELVSAEYLGEGVVEEPRWLQYMRLWGPRIVYDSRAELDRFPVRVRGLVRSLFRKLPGELSGEAGPTGPKEKDYWAGDERG